MTASPDQPVRLYAALFSAVSVAAAAWALIRPHWPGLVISIFIVLIASLLVAKSPRGLTKRLFMIALGFSLGIFAFEARTIWQIQRSQAQWGEFASETSASLARQVDDVTTHAALIARKAGRIIESSSDTVIWFGGLQALHDSSQVDALAIFDPVGELVAWAGDHKAQIPETVRLGKRLSAFVQQPLYSYVYRSHPLREGRGYATAAILLSRTIHGEEHEKSKSGIADALSHATVSIRAGPGSPDTSPIIIGEDTIAHVSVPAASQAHVLGSYLRTFRRIGFALLVVATLTLLIAARALWLERKQRSGSGRRGEIPPRVSLVITIASALLLIALYIVVVALLFDIRLGTGSELNRVDIANFTNRSWRLWFGLQFAAFLILSGVTGKVMALVASPRHAGPIEPHRGRLYSIAAVATSCAASLFTIHLARTDPAVHAGLVSIFSVPIVFALIAAREFRHPRARLYQYALSGWVAAAAVLSMGSAAYVDAQRARADMQLQTLGPKPDARLEYVLLRFANDAAQRSNAGESGTGLLYRSWLASGLASMTYPVRLTLWSPGGVAQAQLALGGSEAAQMPRSFTAPPYLYHAFIRSASDSPGARLLRSTEKRSPVRVAVVNVLNNERILTAEVPPRRSFESGWLPFVSAGSPVGGPRLHLIRATQNHDTTSWRPIAGGWRKEAVISYADGDYRAHVDVPLSPLGVTLARGILLASLDVLLLLCIWIASRFSVARDINMLRLSWQKWRGSVRARITLALFMFFLVPTAVFGWIAFRALSNEVVRATEVVAMHAAEQAAREFQHTGAKLHRIGASTATNVLYYTQGELAAATLPEVKELGVYGAWLPAAVYLSLRRDEGQPVLVNDVAGAKVVTAYAALPGSEALAVPMSMDAAEIQARQLEMSHMILFGVLAGGVLSLLLALQAGRALTEPIAQLQRSAARIGEGDLSVRLPDDKPGEFAALFRSFNRMIRRLRRVRAQEVRAARVLAWGEMARQVAHEIKNPLTPIKLSVQHLRRSYRDQRNDFPLVLDESVGQILTEIDRLAAIAGAFSRYGAPMLSAEPLQPVDLRAIALEALTLYRHADLEVHYAVDIEATVPPVLARRDEFIEVLFNLLENARTALADRPGTIMLSGRCIHHHVEFVVADDGAGISAESLPQIFEPHFSTRTSGTGLGLAIVKRIIESWGGTVRAVSDPGQGTHIIITLRVASAN